MRPPQPPVFLFLVDVSYTAVASGMLRCVSATIKHTLARLPGGERTQVGLITYDSALQFYNLAGSAPQMLVVPEVRARPPHHHHHHQSTTSSASPATPPTPPTPPSQVDDVFLPLPDDILANLQEKSEQFEGLFDQLPTMFANTQTAETCLGPALKAAYQVIQHVGGKLHVFTATRPTVGESPIKNREGAPAAAKPKEGTPTQLQPDGEFYKNLAVDCSKQQVCVDIWSFAGAYTDLATIGQLAKHTTGSVYHYPSFSDAVEGEKLSRDLQHNLTREQGWEAVMRVRASRGLRISSFLGHFFIRGTDLLALPNVDEDKAFAVEIAHEENAQNVSNCCLQAALLYTTSDGERRIRVHTMQVPASAAVATLFESADVDACANVLARLAADQAVKSKLLDGAEKMQTSCMEPLRAFRAICPPQAKAANAVLLPELLKLLPLYALGLMKTAVFSTAAEVRADDRMALIYELATMGCERSVALMHPRLFQLFPPPAAPAAAADGALPQRRRRVPPRRRDLAHAVARPRRPHRVPAGRLRLGDPRRCRRVGAAAAPRRLVADGAADRRARVAAAVGAAALVAARPCDEAGRGRRAVPPLPRRGPDEADDELRRLRDALPPLRPLEGVDGEGNRDRGDGNGV